MIVHPKRNKARINFIVSVILNLSIEKAKEKVAFLEFILNKKKNALLI
jgi:hypothetical protein